MIAALPRLFDRTDADARLIWLIVVGDDSRRGRRAAVQEWIEDASADAASCGRDACARRACCSWSPSASAPGLAPETIADTRRRRCWIGCAQALALIPGVSRSGATITVALLLGLRRADAARFIFLLAIPAILGAAASEGPKLLKAGLGDTAPLFLIGIVMLRHRRLRWR